MTFVALQSKAIRVAKLSVGRKRDLITFCHEGIEVATASFRRTTSNVPWLWVDEDNTVLRNTNTGELIASIEEKT